MRITQAHVVLFMTFLMTLWLGLQYFSKRHVDGGNQDVVPTIEEMSVRLDRLVQLMQQVETTNVTVYQKLKQQIQVLALEKVSLTDALQSERVQRDQLKHALQTQKDDHLQKVAQLEKQLGAAVQDRRRQPHDLVQNGHQKLWLMIGIPTVPRSNGLDYLTPTLQGIADQLPSENTHVLYNRVKVCVMKMQDSPDHAAFENAKSRFGAGVHPHSAYFEFVEEPVALQDPQPNLKDPGSPNKPGWKVRKQTRNIVSLLRHCADRSDFYMFMEDDMQLCVHGFDVIQYMLSKASRYHPNWLAIRASYGMNGVFMRSKDLSTFADYLLAHQSRRPPDHLVVEWYAGETVTSKQYKQQRANIGFRYNIFDHMGVHSTLRSDKSGRFPVCYEELLKPVVFEVEAFNPAQCPKDDIWPCPANKQTYINWSSLTKS